MRVRPPLRAPTVKIMETRFCILCNKRFVPTVFNEETMVEIHGSVTTDKGTYCSKCYEKGNKCLKKMKQKL